MIKLKSIIETINEMDLLFEFPMRISDIDTDVFDDHDKNISYAMATKKHTNIIDKYKKYDIYQFTPKNAKYDIHDVFIFGPYVEAYFNYSINNGFFIEKKVWQGILHLGLCREIIFEYYLKKFNGIISDVLHSNKGEKYWKKLLIQAKSLGYKIYILKNEKERIPLDDLDNIDKFYNSISYRFVIEKV